MLGTNDLMPCYANSAADVAAGVGILLDILATSGAGPSATAPAVLLVAPPRIKAAGMAFEPGYAGVAEESVAISEHYLALATARNCPYFDAAQGRFQPATRTACIWTQRLMERWPRPSPSGFEACSRPRAPAWHPRWRRGVISC